ncbi:hypothetical protein WMZ97_16565 [Lentibacillus sp. N15]|uniref:hypothetical protein n=1 Tax=Lentibacillus songyuanensis TaxID=3136161 RepID=UPI0031B9B288
MLRLKKELDTERITRLKESIILNYIDNENGNELLVSEADLEFLVEKAELYVFTERKEANENNILPINVPNSYKGDDSYSF